ncbi:MFS transporter [Arthrobacter sp. M4]|uniref:MFS transporter n=1 Tax=Arthrobacter sp. M4 TaxID=218160 RepID=UPI0035AC0849|nr:MFS transporter [Arthrobacter sp. M4]
MNDHPTSTPHIYSAGTPATEYHARSSVDGSSSAESSAKAQGTRKRLPGRLARLPELAGRGFLPLGLFARLPLAMLTVGTLTLVTSVSHSFALGGTAAGGVGIGSALGAPLLGAWADRSGQKLVLLTATVANTAAVIGLLMACYMMPSVSGIGESWPMLACALAAGATCPQVGPMARVRWMALTTRSIENRSPAPGNTAGEYAARDHNPALTPLARGSQIPAATVAASGSVVSARADLDTALSYEGTADEITFVLGPALVGALASLVAPWLPLAVAAAMTAFFVPAFAVHPSHLAVVPVPHKPAAGVGHAAVGLPRTGGWLRVAVPVLAMVCMGTFFGATQNALSAFAAEVAEAELAGLLYAVMGLSSAVAALSVAFWPRRFGIGTRWVTAAAAMLALTGLLYPVSGLGPMVAVLLVLGIPVGPVMVAIFSIGGLVAPSGRMATVMTALASGIVAGTALGSFLAGVLAQGSGYTAAFLVASGASACLLVLGLTAAAIISHGRGAGEPGEVGS